MHVLNLMKCWFRRVTRPGQLDADMDDEMRAHIELRTQANIEAGMDPDEARFAALRRFGWAESIKETCREQRGVRWLEILARDVRFGVRQLRKNPGFTAIAVLTLTLGIGVNLALFGLLNDQLLRPRDVAKPEELWAILPSDNSGEPKFLNMSREYYDALRKNNRAFSAIVGYSNIGPRLQTSDGWQPIRATFVSGEFFSFLGVQPLLGRGFLPEEDDKPGTHSVAIISYGFWQNHFQGDPAVLEKTIKLDDRRVEIVGVAPRGFQGINLYQPDLWLPASMEKLFGWSPVYSLLGRLKPGVSPKQAADELTPVVQETTKTLLAGADPIQAKHIARFTRVAMRREGYGSLPAEWAWHGRKELTKAASLVGVASLLVLLITATNLANLVLARALRRSKELATRLALGSSRWTLIRQFMVEGVLLAGLGTLAAMVMFLWLGHLAGEMMPGVVYAKADIRLHFDVRMAAFALASAFGVGAGFSVLPALHASRLDPFTALKDPAGGSGLRGRHWSLRKALMIIQVAGSLVLISCAGLCLRALHEALAVDVGFPTESIAVTEVNLEKVGFTIEQAQPLVDELRRRLSLLPGVEAVGIMDRLPLMGERGHLVTDRLKGYDPPADGSIEFGYAVVGPDCFRALGIPVIEGRDISERDWSARRPVALVNERFARKFWRNQMVLGKRLERLRQNYEIIGIVRDARLNTLAQRPEPAIFFAAGASEALDSSFILRARIDPRFLLRSITAELARIHPGLRKSLVSTLRQFMRVPLRSQRETMKLLGWLGTLALGLTILGIYGTMSSLVTQRTREIGIRMAVGAQRADIARIILSSGSWLGLAGIGLGLPAALCGAALLRHVVYGVSLFDFPSFLLASSTVLAAILAACAIPARRATRVDPLIAMRYE